ncbi:feather beta keratin-like [Ammospiza nelsoni]|uniref:feather beta keratin-like n=1 Tax=Ammospiza nelsoni TaxID=2857394 RepID=UPI002869DE54|nr:feather beta keratin-like [Ammospiza nelsoni]XP_059329746.1 feather beta keratin-like [Ammospiza nelsoni]
MPQGHGTRLSHPSRTSIKASPEPLSVTHSSSSLQLLLLRLPGTLHTTPMACNSLCRPCGPTPLANSCNEPCALQCQDSRVIINPSPVMVTLPGPIMTSFPQNTAVGSTSSAALGTELNAQGQPISGGFGFGLGYGLGGLGCYGRRGYGYIC